MQLPGGGGGGEFVEEPPVVVLVEPTHVPSAWGLPSTKLPLLSRHLGPEPVPGSPPAPGPPGCPGVPAPGPGTPLFVGGVTGGVGGVTGGVTGGGLGGLTVRFTKTNVKPPTGTLTVIQIWSGVWPCVFVSQTV